jgi:hypothetical protein
MDVQELVNQVEKNQKFPQAVQVWAGTDMLALHTLNPKVQSVCFYVYRREYYQLVVFRHNIHIDYSTFPWGIEIDHNSKPIISKCFGVTDLEDIILKYSMSIVHGQSRTKVGFIRSSQGYTQGYAEGYTQGRLDASEEDRSWVVISKPED